MDITVKLMWIALGTGVEPEQQMGMKPLLVPTQGRKPQYGATA